MTTARDFARYARSVRFVNGYPQLDEQAAFEEARANVMTTARNSRLRWARLRFTTNAITNTLPACDDLRRAPWKGSANFMAGHCYVASEALWHALGGMASEWRPQVVRHEGATHWFLRSLRTAEVLDITRDQFKTPVPYEAAHGCGFLTRDPSKRARELLFRTGLTVTIP